MGLIGGHFQPVRVIGLTLLVLLLLYRVFDPLPLKTIRLSAFDFYQVIKPREYSKQPIMIVDLDEESLRQFGQWPWPRTLIADLINGIAERGGVATGFDIVFAEPDRLSPPNIAKDNANLSPEIRKSLNALPHNETVMANAMKSHPVVLGQASIRNFRDNSSLKREIRTVGRVFVGEDPIPFLQKSQLNHLIQNMEILEDSASGYGLFTIDPDADNVVRRVPLVALVRDKIRLSLSAELLRVATGGESFAIKSDQAGITGITVAGSLIETDGNGYVWPYFSPTIEERYISASKILDGSVKPSMVDGNMILIGTSVAGLEDLRATPLGVQMPGVEIHAQLIENILTDKFLKRPSFALLIEFLAALFSGLLVIALVPRLGGVRSSVGIITLVVGLLGYSWWSFSSHQLLIDATYPIIVTTTLFILTITASYIREERQRQRIRGAFGQYLSPALVDQLTEHPEKLVLGGETRELSILFSDIRGFTTISEDYRENPAGLTKLMNSVLTELTKPILKNNGTIDKYLGDAVMAFWNAPINEDDHAYLACRAALRMIERIAVLNDGREQSNGKKQPLLSHEIKIGIGINTGFCVVGNMGSDTRFDYTALGDSVNIASRLEGQSKPYGVPIVIGESTAELIKERLALYQIDYVRVIGKNEPIHIYALAGFEDLAKAEDFMAFKALNALMLSSYKGQDWQSALDAIEMIEDLNKKLELPLDEYLFIYQARIEEFRNNPPGKHWDGVYSVMNK